MSMLKNQQLTACEQRLLQCPRTGIFDAGITAGELMDIWSHSFYAQEHKALNMPQREELCALVLSSAADEAALLSEGEESLVQRLLFSDGETQLISWEEITFAEALVRRFWCTVTLSGDKDKATLKLQPPLIEPLVEIMGTEAYALTREKMFALDATLHGLLYLTGFLYANVPISHFLSDVIARRDETARLLLARSLRAAYDYCFDAQGDMLLLHPGLADPEKLLRGLRMTDVPEPTVTQEMLLGGMNGLLKEEEAACELMTGAICNALRPEYTLDEAVQDLRIMVKQGANFEETRQVLTNMLAVLPTDRMLSALKRIEMETVRWAGVPATVLH